MNKKQIALLIFIVVVVVWLLNLFIGNWLTARISTLPLARELNLFNPQAPIVVNNREVVRVNNTNDVVEVAQNAQSKISSVVSIDNGQVTVLGGAINWTSDGYFISTKNIFSETTETEAYAVVTGTGEFFSVEDVYPDPASNLVLLKTPARGVPVLDITKQDDIRVGDQVVLLLNSIERDFDQFSSAYIKRLAEDVSATTKESDLLSGNYELDFRTETNLGEPVLDLSGRLIGVWDGAVLIPGSDIQSFVNNFFDDGQAVLRPSYGFSYRHLSESESRAVQAVSGVQLIALDSTKPAAIAGLLPGDVIVKFNGAEIKSDTDFDRLLREVSPAQEIEVVITRDGVEQTVVLTPSVLR